MLSPGPAAVTRVQCKNPAGALLGWSVLECAVASAAACGCLGDVEKPEAAADDVLAQSPMQRTRARLGRSRASISP